MEFVVRTEVIRWVLRHESTTEGWELRLWYQKYTVMGRIKDTWSSPFRGLGPGSLAYTLDYLPTPLHDVMPVSYQVISPQGIGPLLYAAFLFTM